MLNETGLTKTLLTRRETIYLKYVLKNTFIYGNEQDLQVKEYFENEFHVKKY